MDIKKKRRFLTVNIYFDFQKNKPPLKFRRLKINHLIKCIIETKNTIGFVKSFEIWHQKSIKNYSLIRWCKQQDGFNYSREWSTYNHHDEKITTGVVSDYRIEIERDDVPAYIANKYPLEQLKRIYRD